MANSSPATPDEVTMVHNLAKGILELYEPPLTTINTHLKELTEKQESVENMFASERRRLEDLQNSADLDALMADVATNNEKLTNLSNKMLTLHKRVQSLSARAAVVQKAANLKATQSKAAT